MHHHLKGQPTEHMRSDRGERVPPVASAPGIDEGGRGPNLPISASAPMAGPDQSTHYRVSGGRVSIITDPYEVAIATAGAIRALTASAIRAASSDSNADRSEP